ncbi:hypothetical protein MMC14_002785 [Varicellaria rhodocarpa]|nr:hypothetical protein [Varicellaria rhodocarpa]
MNTPPLKATSPTDEAVLDMGATEDQNERNSLATATATATTKPPTTHGQQEQERSSVTAIPTAPSASQNQQQDQNSATAIPSTAPDRQEQEQEQAFSSTSPSAISWGPLLSAIPPVWKCCGCYGWQAGNFTSTCRDCAHDQCRSCKTDTVYEMTLRSNENFLQAEMRRLMAALPPSPQHWKCCACKATHYASYVADTEVCECGHGACGSCKRFATSRELLREP